MPFSTENEGTILTASKKNSTRGIRHIFARLAKGRGGQGVSYANLVDTDTWKNKSSRMKVRGYYIAEIMCAILSAQFAGLPDRNQISTIIFQLKLGCDVRGVAVCAKTISDRFEHSIRKQVSIDKEFRGARGSPQVLCLRIIVLLLKLRQCHSCCCYLFREGYVSDGNFLLSWFYGLPEHNKQVRVTDRC